MPLNQVIDGRFVVRHFKLVAHNTDELTEIGFGRILNFDLVRNASQKGIVYQVAGFEIGGKNDELFERNLDLFATQGVKKVITFLKWDNPTIEQFIRPHPLPAEIIDHKRPAITFHLQGCLADASGRVETYFKLIHGQFTTHDDRGSLNLHPPMIQISIALQPTLFEGSLLMNHRIEEA